MGKKTKFKKTTILDDVFKYTEKSITSVEQYGPSYIQKMLDADIRSAFSKYIDIILSNMVFGLIIPNTLVHSNDIRVRFVYLIDSTNSTNESRNMEFDEEFDDKKYIDNLVERTRTIWKGDHLPSDDEIKNCNFCKEYGVVLLNGKRILLQASNYTIDYSTVNGEVYRYSTKYHAEFMFSKLDTDFKLKKVRKSYYTIPQLSSRNMIDIHRGKDESSIVVGIPLNIIHYINECTKLLHSFNINKNRATINKEKFTIGFISSYQFKKVIEYRRKMSMMINNDLYTGGNIEQIIRGSKITKRNQMKELLLFERKNNSTSTYKQRIQIWYDYTYINRHEEDANYMNTYSNLFLLYLGIIPEINVLTTLINGVSLNSRDCTHMFEQINSFLT